MRIEPYAQHSVSSYKALAGQIGKNNKSMFSSLRKLSSGLKITTAADSPSGLAMSERMRSLIGRYDAAVGNAQNAVSYLETSDGFMQSMQNTVGRMQELAIAANDGTKSDMDRELLSMEFEELKGSINSVTSGDAPSGSYNGKPLFQGDSMDVAIGPEPGETMSFSSIDLTESSSTSVGLDSSGNDIPWSDIVTEAESGGLDIRSQEGASAAIESLSMANDYMSQMRAVRGAEQERVQQTLSGIQSAQVNMVSAESGIRDADIALEMINFTRYQTMGNMGRGMLALGNSNQYLAKA